MAALVQGYPQQSGTVTMLQTRPASASGVLQTVPLQPNAQYVSGGSRRHSVHGLPSSATTPVVYRGSSGPVQPYAFTSTPSLNPTPQRPKSRTERISSSPAVPTNQTTSFQQLSGTDGRLSGSRSMTNLLSTATNSLSTGPGPQDDSALPVPGTRRATTAPQPSPSLAPAAPIRVSPERYRRSALRTPDSAGLSPGQRPQGATSNPATTVFGHTSNLRNVSDQKTGSVSIPSHPSLSGRPNSYVGSVSGSAVDDMVLPHSEAQGEIKRVRRRSMPALDSAGFPVRLTPLELNQLEESIRPKPPSVPKSSDKDSSAAKTGDYLVAGKGGNRERAGSSNSSSSARSTESSSGPTPSAHRNENPSDPTRNSDQSTSQSDQAGASQGTPRLVNIPPRSSSSDAATASAKAKRVTSPPPPSGPATMEMEGEGDLALGASDPAKQEPAPATPRAESPAVKQLTAINETAGRPKSKTSRLRRAFSFGSAAEFRKVVQDSDAADKAKGRLHKERDPADGYDAEQARIAQQQEEAGIGSSIYSGGKLFSASTDNLSISSTASSASIMIRKMGRGMKRGTRSLVGLFRPKSLIGASAADVKQSDTTQAAVSMVTAEAERERVNVNPHPRTQTGGGTGFPRLERNSIDAAKVPSSESERVGSSETDRSAARKSIVGGEKERAEVLAAVTAVTAVRKGILKNRSGSSSPSLWPQENKGAASDLPAAPQVADSDSSSAPSTPNEDSQGHKRAGTVAIGSEDYFVSALRLRQDTKSAPGTPRGTMKRNATFSPRIVFFETWPSQEYDRRGDIATCNRLTPMLAQQIKEELNSFKMEMEVHENSKIYTHFF
ncbi:hypothetical protein VTK56DRAFT_5744 [Thermocarpiscus australiensis]